MNIIMKRLIIGIVAVLTTATYLSAQEMPKGYEKKTKALAENFVECSREGNYNKVYHSLRKIQKYQLSLQKEQLVVFHEDLHTQVQSECDRLGLSQDIKDNFREVIESMFSMKLREDLEAASSNKASEQ